jgi:hypothetical protein
MALAGLAVTTIGSNADLNDPIAVALRKMGKPASNPVVDGDLSSLADVEFDELLDRAALRTLQTLAGPLSLVDVSVGPRRESQGQLSGQIEKQIEQLSRSIEREFGPGAQELSGGIIDLGYQAAWDVNDGD